MIEAGVGSRKQTSEKHHLRSRYELLSSFSITTPPISEPTSRCLSAVDKQYFDTRHSTALQSPVHRSLHSRPTTDEPVGGDTVTAADFRLFLCHLYFASHYCYPSFLPPTKVYLASSAAPLSLEFDPVSLLGRTRARRSCAPQPVVRHSSVTKRC